MAVAYYVSQPSLVNNFFKMGAYMYLMIELTSKSFVVDDAVDDLLVLTASGLSFGTRGNLLKTAVIISHTGALCLEPISAFSY